MTVHIATSVAADLNSLTTSLGQTGIDLQSLLHELADGARAAVASYRGLSITMFLGAYPLTLPAMEDGTDVGGTTAIGSSARVAISALCDADPRSTIVFYASTAGAFVDFAADVQYALGADSIVLDADLTPPAIPAPNQLRDVLRLHQAVGILIAQGHSPTDAHGELQRRALHGQRPVMDAALQLVDSIGPDQALWQPAPVRQPCRRTTGA